MYANYHLDDEEFERYSMGAMPEAAIAPFEEHLLVCEPCQLRLAQTDAYVGAMRQASRVLGRSLSNADSPGCVSPPGPCPGRHGSGDCGGRFVDQPSGYGRGAPVCSRFGSNARAAIEARAPAGRWLLLRLDLANLPASSSYRLEMVDRFGSRIYQALWRHRDRKPASWFRERSRGSTSCASTGRPRTASGVRFRSPRPSVIQPADRIV